MTVQSIYTDGLRFTVTGEGYAPGGTFVAEDGTPIGPELPAPLAFTLTTAALCNNAHIVRDPSSRRWKVVGDPTEGALLTVAAKGGLHREVLEPADEIIQELPFDSDRKRMTVITRTRAAAPWPT